MKFESRLGRTVEKNTLVGVHWNAHRSCWSIVQMKSRNTIGLVIGYADNLTLTDCTVKIDKSKQKNVRDSGVKDRHAFIVGRFENFNVEAPEKKLYYNPHKLDSFVDAEQFECGNVEYLAHMDRVNFDSWKKLYPVVRYA